MVRHAEDFAENIRNRLICRNRQEVYAFQEVVLSHTKLQRTNAELQRKLVALEKEVTTEKESRVAVEKQLELQAESFKTEAEKDRQAREETTKSLQQELNHTYKKNAEVCEQLVVARGELQATQATLKLTQENLAERESELGKTRSHLEEVGNSLEEERAAKALVVMELENRQVDTEEARAKCTALERENARVVDQLLELKLKEAQKLNEANEIYEDVVRSAKAIKTTTTAGLERMVSSAGRIETTGSSHQTEPPPGENPLPSRPLYKFLANKGGTQAMCWNSSGSRIATCGLDREVHLWEAGRVNSGPTQSLRGALGTLMDLAFSPDDSLLLAGGSDKAIRLWDVESGRVKHTLTGHSDKVSAVSFNFAHSNIAVSCGADRCIKVWDLVKGYCVKTVMCPSTCNALTLTLDGGMICSGHFDGSARFWDVRSGEQTFEVSGLHSHQVTSVSLSPTGNDVLTNSRDNHLKILDLRSFQVGRVLKQAGYRNGLNWCRACYSPDGRHVAAGSADGSVFIWSLAGAASQNPAVIQGHRVAVACCAWSSSGMPLASVDKNGECIMWQ